VTRAIFAKPAAMLSTLQAKMTRTDIQGEVKQQSLLHAVINSIYNNTRSSDEQGLLLCLARLKFSVNRETLAAYSQRLRQHAVLARLPFDNCEKYLIKNGRLGLITPLFRCAFTVCLC